jgi:deoxyribodipyrimidine photolyase-related protein
MGIASLADRSPEDCRVLLVESRAKLESKPWHVQRAHLVVSAMAHFAAELVAIGFEVDHRQAPTLADGVRSHCEDFGVTQVVAMEPMSWDGRSMLVRLGVDIVDNNQFLCHYEEFAQWVGGRSSTRMEDFYRWQRTRLGILMDGEEPMGGRWNFDKDNREPPPTDGRSWPEITRFPLDAIDEEVLGRLPDCWGAAPHGKWPVTRGQALTRLEEFVADGLGPFGPHEDAMLSGEWKLAHSVLASSLNLGLLHPREVVEAAAAAYLEGSAPINSVEGFVRQVLGWREYVWGMYWLNMPDFRSYNRLDAHRRVPPAFTGDADTEMACVASVVTHVHENAYAHHIERLMVLGNLALTAGVDPLAMTRWMWASFVDAAEWVMVPNVIMALYADAGLMATKPYASGGAYINRMSDHCRGCRYDPRKRTGPDACPFTTLYWDFLARNEVALAGNHRVSRQLAAMRRLSDLDSVKQRAAEVLAALDAGSL